MQPDGNFVLYDGGRAVWATGTGSAGTRAVMQADGNFVLYDRGAARWNTRTGGFSGAYLVLQNDGNLVLYRSSVAIWTRHDGYRGNVLKAGQTLLPGARLRSLGGRMRLEMQTDGNLVLYESGTARWSTGGQGAGARAVVQSDGNLVVYNGRTARWQSSTTGFDGAYLSVQDDANLVMYAQGRAIWTRGSGYIGDTLSGGNTLPPGAFLRSSDGRLRLVMQPGDGNLVLYGPSGALWTFGTAGHPGARAVMQSDGNFVVVDGSTPVNHTGTGGNNGAWLKLQDDDNLVVYRDAEAIWSRKGPVQHPAAAWAAAQVGARTASAADAALFPDWIPGPYGEWSGDCAKFVYAAWYRAGKEIKKADAVGQYRFYKSRVQQGPAPSGALVFYPDVPDVGHIAISDGAGGVYTTQGRDHANLPVARLPVGYFGPPAGWVMP